MPALATTTVPKTTIGTLQNDIIDLSNDTVGGLFYHTVYGDLGWTNTTSGPPADIIAGNDTITGGNTGNLLIGDVSHLMGGTLHAGDDILIGGAGSDKIYGDVEYSDGFATGITIIGGNDSLYGGDGFDQLWGGTGNDLIDGGAGFDIASYTQFHVGQVDGAHVVVDLELGKSWSDYYGNDTLVNIEAVAGSWGDDWIGGSSRADTLDGGSGSDVVHGFGGDDVITDFDPYGNDALYGDAGNDTITVGHGGAWVSGGDGNDTLKASNGKSGQWTAVHGDAGNDTIDGSSINGSVGLYGDAGDDLIRFGSGTSYIEGGAGADKIGPSASAFTDPNSFAQVFDFDVGVDKVTLENAGSITSSGVDIRDWGPNTGIVITDTAGHATTLMLMGVTAHELNMDSDFIFLA